MSDPIGELVDVMTAESMKWHQKGRVAGWRACLDAVRELLAAHGFESAVELLTEAEVAAFVAEMEASDGDVP